MDNQQSNTHSEGLSLPQSSYSSSSAANSYIHGDGSGNSGSNNNINSSNINYNYFNRGGASSSQKHAEILQCLYTSGYESHRGRVREPVVGTCIWVTEHPKYKDWLEQKTSGLLWLSADPGCGKSVIASFLVTHLKIQTNAKVCYFFFKDDSEEQRNATFALCAILHQLFMQRNSLCRFAEAAFKGKGRKFTEEVDTLWEILVKVVAGAGRGDVICVLDALDECEERTLTRLIHHVTRLPGSQTPKTHLKFVVTSRPYHKIDRELGSKATTIRLKGEDEVNAITADVARVIDNGIKELELVWENPGELEYLRDLLSLSADRTFLWVSLVLEILKDSVDGSRKELTNIVSAAPRNLADFYTKILVKSPNSDKARWILHIVVAAARPLTLVEMNVALAIRRGHKSMRDIEGGFYPSFEKTLKNLCGLFVRVIDSKVYLVHQTAREFLIKESLPGRGNWQYTLCPKDSNFILADICICYLSLEEFENDPLAVDGYSSVGGKSVDYLQKYGFLDYAARHWAGHFRDSQEQQMVLFEFAKVICGANKRFQTWFQVYWLNSGQWQSCPTDWTHLMIASWFGQGRAVGRLLEEGGDINARSKRYGTALNIAAFRKREDIARMLLQKGVMAYINGKEYNILHTDEMKLLLLLRDLDERRMFKNSRPKESPVRERDQPRFWNGLITGQPRFWDHLIADLWLAECCSERSLCFQSCK